MVQPGVHSAPDPLSARVRVSADILAGMAAQHGTTLEELRALGRKAGRPAPATDRLRKIRMVIADDAHKLGVSDADVTAHLGLTDPHAARKGAQEARDELVRDARRKAEAKAGPRRCDMCQHWTPVGGVQGECRYDPPRSAFKGDAGFWPQIAGSEPGCDKHTPLG